MKKFGQLNMVLRVQFDMTDNGIKMHQGNHIDRVVNFFNLNLMVTASIPLTPGYEIREKDWLTKKKKFMRQISFRNLLCSLMFIVAMSRPDILIM